MVHDRTRTAILHLLDQSIPLLVATGRRVASTRAPLAAIGLLPPAVVLNGALGLDLASGDRFHCGGFSPDEADTVLEARLAHGAEPCIYLDQDEPSVWVSPNPSTHPDHIVSFDTDVGSGDLRAIVEREHLAAIATPHVDRDRGYGGWSVTVAPRAQSKWDGVAAFCALHGLDPNAVMAVGDGPNDAELLENAAIAVVLDDAHHAAQRHADYVVGAARDGGWADILHLLDLTLPG